MFVVDVDDDFLDWLQLVTVIVFLEDHFWTGNAKFEAFAAHGLDQNGKLKLAPTGHFKRLCVGGAGDFQCDIAFGFLEEAIPDHTGGHLGAFCARQR